MKVTNLKSWISDNIGNIAITLIIVFFGVLVAVPIYSEFQGHKEFPIGSDVIVKGTDVHGTVTRWYGSDTVQITFVKSDGTPVKMEYNHYLLKKQ